MRTEKEPDSADQVDPSRIEGDVDESGEPEPSDLTDPTSLEAPVGAELPTEPPYVWERADADYDPAKTLNELIAFYLYGQRGPHPVPSATDPRPMPALLRPYGDLSNVRYDYPICLTDTGVRPLAAIVDELVKEVATEGDAGETLKRQVYQLESSIKSLANKREGERLYELWDRAAESMVSSRAPEKKEILQENLALARKALKADGELFTDAEGVPRCIFASASTAYWREKCQGWREELDTLIRRMQDILGADFSHSPEAQDPEHLRASVGTKAAEDMDFEAMADILGESHLGDPLPETRRARVQQVLDKMLQLRPLYAGEVEYGSADMAVPFDVRPVVNDTSAAAKQWQDRGRVMVDFFKAVHIARLEMNNRYRDAAHDLFFSQFDASYLADEELALFPPVLLYMSDAAFTETSSAALLDILGAGAVIKVLLEVTDLCGGGNGTDLTLGWQTKLANALMGFDHVYVMQSPVSRPTLLQSGFSDGLRYDGPALLSVYKGNTEDNPGLSAYLGTGAAMESRAFPAFTFDPGKGTTWSERIDIHENPQSDRDWPTESFSYRKADGEETTVELAFTLADFLSGDIRLASHFWDVPAQKWHRDMISLTEYLGLDAEGANGKVPYLTVVDDDNRLGRVVMTRAVLKALARCESAWHNLQEQGGVNNSFALNLLAEEKGRLAAEKQREVEEIENKYVLQLDQDVSGLTMEIIQRIAAQLLAQGDSVSAAAFAPPPVAAPTPTEAAAVETEEMVEKVVEEEDEEEESLGFDDPYIDTPLCTTCNECTNLNGQMFVYNENKQAVIKDAQAGTYRDLVIAAEKCPVHIIHPGKPKNPDEANLDDLLKRAAKYN